MKRRMLARVLATRELTEQELMAVSGGYDDDHDSKGDTCPRGGMYTTQGCSTKKDDADV